MSISVGNRLKQLSGMSNATFGAMLLVIGTGATVGAILVNYSGLPTGTVAQHLLADKTTLPPSNRVYQIRFEIRRLLMASEDRLIIVPADVRRVIRAAESRNMKIVYENRRITIPAENRRVVV